MAKDYYQVLEIEKTDDQEVIKKAYREKAKQLHPDKSKQPNAQEVFQQLNEAYMVLSDPEEKVKYDKGDELPAMSYSEVEEILRRRDEYMRDGESIFRWRPRNIYPPTNYEANKNTSVIINTIITTIALLFIIDYAVIGKINTYLVESVWYDEHYMEGKKEFRVVLGNVKIQVFGYYPPVQAGEDAGVSFSPIFISPQYLINTSGENYRIGDKRHVIGIAIVALIFSALGMMPFSECNGQMEYSNYRRIPNLYAFR